MVSAVIPVLNGGERFAGCLSALVPGLAAGVLREAIVVDGGSSDASGDLARDFGCTVLEPGRGRGLQLAAGIARARGPWLLLLHADTILSPGWVGAVQAHLQQAAMAGGSPRAGFFRLAFDDPGPQARRVAGLANWRARALGLPYGDQGLLISRAHLDAAGGVRPLPLMEDLDLVRRIGRGGLSPLDAEAQTSAERYRRGGWWTTPARNLILAGLFLAGVPATRLAGLYR